MSLIEQRGTSIEALIRGGHTQTEIKEFRVVRSFIWLGRVLEIMGDVGG
jgi:hypothetical protein